MPHNSQLVVGGGQAKCCPSCRAFVFVLDRDLPATCPNCRELFRRRLLVPPKPLSLPVPRDPPKNFSPSLARQDQPTLTTRHPSPPPNLISTPDPLSDVTRIRVRSRASHCLYPGAKFQGTQKSGRNSYDVTVTIVVRSPLRYPNPQLIFLQDVDFATSFLCGYLCIRGLTDDWPELTTYFDAEIIGSRYGFLTQNWGASENEDIVHWSRFPAFRNIRHEAMRPRLTIDDRDRGAVFMRWKEKFLVPDHRVHDISGASFAGHLNLFFPKIVLLNNPSRVLLCLRRLQPSSNSPCRRLKQ